MIIRITSVHGNVVIGYQTMSNANNCYIRNTHLQRVNKWQSSQHQTCHEVRVKISTAAAPQFVYSPVEAVAEAGASGPGRRLLCQLTLPTNLCTPRHRRTFPGYRFPSLPTNLCTPRRRRSFPGYRFPFARGCSCLNFTPYILSREVCAARSRSLATN